MPSADGPSAEATRRQLQRILASGAFAHAPILSQFLRHVVEHGIDAAETPLKEYTIGVEVFGRGADFDPQVDTIVRVEARRLRAYLDKYYEGEGRDDPILITIPKGHYRAELAARQPAPGPATGDEPEQPASRVGRQLSFRGRGLPASRTPMIGRDRERVELEALLGGDGPRLVTLTGAAAIGKTRLAVEVARTLQQGSFDDVVFVALAAVTDGSTLQVALLRTFELALTRNTPPAETLCRHLQRSERKLLLVLDNFEQLAAAASLIGSMLDASTLLKVLVTSRRVLHLYGEHEYPLMPLALPEGDCAQPGELRAFPAVALFVQHAVAVNPDFRLTEANGEAVVRVCRHLDGLPLGIELAAAQCLALAPAQLLEHYPGPLDLPAARTEDLPLRQRSLREAIEWSHDLLGEDERRLYRRLAVFSGGFTLAAAVAVANWRGDLGIGVIEGVARLLDDSLLDLVSDPVEPRYTMLETIRAHALERLNASAEYDDLRRVHAAYFLGLADEGQDVSFSQTSSQWLARCERDQGNFRAAVMSLLALGDEPGAARLSRALFSYWRRRRHLPEARWLRLLGPGGSAARARARPREAFHAGAPDQPVGTHGRQRTDVHPAPAVGSRSGIRKTEITAFIAVGVSWEMARHLHQACGCFERSLELCRETPESPELAAVQSNLAHVLLALGQPAQARVLLEQACASFEQGREWSSAGWCLARLAAAAAASGRPEEARRLCHRSVERFLQSGAEREAGETWSDLAYLALRQGQQGLAAAGFGEALKVVRQARTQAGVANVIEGCAMLAAARHQFPRALVLAAAAEAVRSSPQIESYAEAEAGLSAALQPARDAVGAARTRACHRRGAAMDSGQAIDYAARGLIEDPDPSG